MYTKGRNKYEGLKYKNAGVGIQGRERKRTAKKQPW
jgi:hypothetical protein